jgi:hypothetical protein
MAEHYEREPGDSPGRFINRIGEGVRSDLEESYTERLLHARQEMREEQDRADAERICSNEALKVQRMGEYRRGRWYQLGGIAASAVSGFTSGYFAQRQADLRPLGVPFMAITGLPGVIVGAVLDEAVATRAAFVVGGTMFSVGATTYTLLNPRLPADGVKP